MTFKNLIAARQYFTNQYAAHHGLPIPHLEVDGDRGEQSRIAFKLALFYLGYDGPDWRSAKYNSVTDQQAIAWLQHPSSRNLAMKAKGAYRQRNKTGLVVVRPDANLVGHSIHPWVLSDVGRIALYAKQTITILTGTNHCKYVLCDPSQNISDHWAGNAADLSPNGRDDGPNGDMIAAAALRVAGLTEVDAWAQARYGGEHIHIRGGYRYDILWKTDTGGNHHNHIHVGIRPV